MRNDIIVMFVIFTRDLIQIVNSVGSPFVFLGHTSPTFLNKKIIILKKYQ